MFRLILLLALASQSFGFYCSYSHALGTWKIGETARDGDDTLDCSTTGPIMYNKEFTLEYPDVVTDELGFTGKWSLLGAMGFEININERSYWAEFDYGAICRSVYIGRARDDTVRHWSCFTGEHTGAVVEEEAPVAEDDRENAPWMDDHVVNDEDFINRINAAQTSWTAKAYTEHEKYTYREMHHRAGGSFTPLPGTKPPTEEEKAAAALLPENFDWQDVEGVNYITPVRDQGSCGSCYSFASMGMVEARVRIETGNERTEIFSPQHAVSCSDLTAGCGGGYHYLTAGRFAKDVGLVTEDCVPYTGYDDPCTTDPSCPRTFTKDYQFVGGYYGASNEENMMEALVKHGPLPVDFNVESDFYNYNGGIYHHVASVKSDFDPYFPCNHEVLLVGYGVDPSTGEKFWHVKNSWGATWGEYGFFRIRRGTNEVGIESSVFDASIIS